MRSVMKVSRETIARRLATSPATIDTFEAGAIAALPSWKETARIIRGYCELMRMDPDPILFRIRDRLGAAAAQARPARPNAAPPPPGVQPYPRPPPAVEAEPARARRSVGRPALYALLALGAPLVVAPAVAILTLTAPSTIYRVVGWLPASIALPARAALDRVVMYAAPSREGLKWIEFGDPRLRKADKLHTSRR